MQLSGLTQQDSNSVVKLSINEKITIKLESEPGTGFEWILEDKSIGHFDDIKVDYEPLTISKPIHTKELTVISLEATQPGKGELILRYLRPWNPADVKRTFRVNYSIKDSM